MEVGRGDKARTIDGAGAAGYTAMQYANDAKGVKGWSNNMEIGGEGTYTAPRRIRPGDELLFAYDKGGLGGYLEGTGRWGKAEIGQGGGGESNSPPHPTQPNAGGT